MSALTVRLPNSLHAKIKELAKAVGLSINQFLVTAAAEKMAALLTEDYLAQEAKQGKRADFEKVLKAVPHVEPEEHDRLWMYRFEMFQCWRKNVQHHTSFSMPSEMSPICHQVFEEIKCMSFNLSITNVLLEIPDV